MKTNKATSFMSTTSLSTNNCLNILSIFIKDELNNYQLLSKYMITSGALILLVLADIGNSDKIAYPGEQVTICRQRLCLKCKWILPF